MSPVTGSKTARYLPKPESWQRAHIPTQSEGVYWHATQKPFYRRKSFWFAASFSIFTFALATDEEIDGYTRNRYWEKALANDPNKNAAQIALNFAHWSSLVLLNYATNKIAKYDATFELYTKAIERYLEKKYYLYFEENNFKGKQRVFFRGEHAASAKLIPKTNRGAIMGCLRDEEFSLPSVDDVTLNPDGCTSFTKAVVSVTSDLEQAESWGNGESVLLIVPRRKIACTALNGTKENEGGEFEYICTGIHKDELLLIAYKEKTAEGCNTDEFVHVEFNPAFKGDISQLELDPQIEKILCAIPDSDPRKMQLRNQINSTCRYQEDYESRLAPCLATHRAATQARKLRRSLLDTLTQKDDSFFKLMKKALYSGFFSLAIDTDAIIETFEQTNIESETQRTPFNHLFTTDRGVYTRCSPQLGGNTGATYVRHDGRQYYIKYELSKNGVNDPRFHNEILLSKLYAACGLQVPDIHLVHFVKNDQMYVGVASRFEPYLSYSFAREDEDTKTTIPGWYDNQAFRDELNKHGLLHLIFGNYDVINLFYENTNGKLDPTTQTWIPFYTDAGAGVRFKATGQTPLKLKPDATDFLMHDADSNQYVPGNWFCMHDEQSNNAETLYCPAFSDIFEKLHTDPQTLEKAIQFADKQITDAKINRVFLLHGYGDEQLRRETIEIIKKRRDAVIEAGKGLLAQQRNALAPTHPVRFFHTHIKACDFDSAPSPGIPK